MAAVTAELLAGCLDAIRAGSATLDGCLAEHPAEAEALRPLLRLALSLTPAEAAAPDPAFRARARATLLQAIIAERAAGRWPRLRRRFAGARGGSRRLLPLPALAALLGAVLLAAGGGVVIAAQRALPGDALYPVKTSLEQLRLQLATGDAERARAYLDLAGRRADELRRAVQAGRGDAIDAAASGYVRDVRDARASLLKAASVGQADPLAAELATRLARQQTLLQAAAAQAPNDVKPAVHMALGAASVPLPVRPRIGGEQPPPPSQSAAQPAADGRVSAGNQPAGPMPTDAAEATAVQAAPVATGVASETPKTQRLPLIAATPDAPNPGSATAGPDRAVGGVAQAGRDNTAGAARAQAGDVDGAPGRGQASVQEQIGERDDQRAQGAVNATPTAPAAQAQAGSDAGDSQGNGPALIGGRDGKDDNGKGSGDGEAGNRANGSSAPQRSPTSSAGNVQQHDEQASGQPGDGSGPLPGDVSTPIPRPPDGAGSGAGSGQDGGGDQHSQGGQNGDRGGDQGNGPGNDRGGGQPSGQGNGRGNGQGDGQGSGPIPTKTPKPGRGNE